MNYALRICSITLLIFGVSIGGVAFIAPYIGLGNNESYILYEHFAITRSATALTGIALVFVGLISYFVIANFSAVSLNPISLNFGSKSNNRNFVSNAIAYFSLPKREKHAPFIRRDQLIIAVLSFLFAIPYMYRPMIFECDAAMFLNYSRFFIDPSNGGYTFARPPGFPFFLLATGQPIFDSFVGTILAHTVLGVMMPIIVYRLLVPASRTIAISAAIVFIVSTYPFFGIKMMLSTQLFIFFILTCCYFYSRYYFTSDPRFIYMTFLFGFFAMFTRWEGQFVLLFCAAGLFFLTWQRSNHLRFMLLATGLLAVMIMTWSGTRSFVYRDVSLIGTLHNGSGQQLFWRLYQHFPATILGLNKKFGIELPDGDARLIPRQHNKTGSLALRSGIKLVAPENGPATMQLRKIIVKQTREHPEGYRNLKEVLPDLPNGLTKYDVYDDLFGRFEQNPEAFADHLFDYPNGIYPNYVFGLLNRELGIGGADSLLSDVAVEAVQRNPTILLNWATHISSYFGLNLLGAIDIARGASVYNALPIFTYWGKYHYSDIAYDAGGCASRYLPERMFLEYSSEFDSPPPNWVASALDIGNFTRNLTRNMIGLIFLLTFWALLFSKQRGLFLSFFFSAGTLICAYGVAAGGAYTRYEFPVAVLLLLTTAGAISGLIRLIKK
ncbi:hypothetical protein N9L49_01725 [Rhodospirillales bacterium]|nr:hypothetical protein [Rhodospirillales bacterium]